MSIKNTIIAVGVGLVGLSFSKSEEEKAGVIVGAGILWILLNIIDATSPGAFELPPR